MRDDECLSWESLVANWNIGGEELFRLKIKFGEVSEDNFALVVADIALHRMSDRLYHDADHRKHKDAIIDELMKYYIINE